MMDVITGKTRPDAGTAFFGQTIDLTRLTRARDRRSPASAASSRSRRCSSTTRCSRTSSSRCKADKRVRPTLHARLDRRQRDRIADDRSRLIQLAPEAGAPGGPAVARPEAVARDRHAADAGAAAAAARRAGRRHDRRRDDAHAPSCSCRSPASHTLVVVEHDMDFVARIARNASPCCTKAACSPKARWTQVQQNEQVIEVYLGR